MPQPINPNSIYSKTDLAEIFGVSVKTIERWCQMSAKELQDGKPAMLPPPFYVGRMARWLGSAVLDHSERLQSASIGAV